MERRRSSVEVIADILRLGQAGKTEIMYSANMSYFQLQKYLNYLLKLGLIDKVVVSNPVHHLSRDGKGIGLTEEYRRRSGSSAIKGSRVKIYRIRIRNGKINIFCQQEPTKRKGEIN